MNMRELTAEHPSFHGDHHLIYIHNNKNYFFYYLF